MRAFESDRAARSHIPRIVHGTALISGGVLAGLTYEMVGRPFDVARRTIELHHVAESGQSRFKTAFRTLQVKIQHDGLLSFFRAPASLDSSSASGADTNLLRRRLFSTLRVLGRVGPWGAGFLIWEAFGPGLSP